MLTMSRGNVKVKANIFNLPSKTTCKANLKCHGYCYSSKAEVQYPAVLPSRENNFQESLKSDFVDNAIKLLKTRKNKIVRIHESGDFYSMDYVIAWFSIANALPEYTFYAYTKRDDIFTEDVLKYKPKNFTLIYSIDGLDVKAEKPKGFDKIARVSSTETNCPAQIKKGVLCGVQCKMCFSSKVEEIVFKKH